MKNQTRRITTTFRNAYHDKRVKWGIKSIPEFAEGMVIHVTTRSEMVKADTPAIYLSVDVPMNDGYGTRHVSGYVIYGVAEDTHPDNWLVTMLIRNSVPIATDTFASICHEVEGMVLPGMAAEVIDVMLRNKVITADQLRETLRDVLLVTEEV